MQELDQKFWARFAKTTWEKKSIAVTNIRSPLLELDQDEIFKLLVVYSDRCRKIKSADGMKFYIQGHRQFESEVLRHLPRKSDRTLQGYHERMNSQYEDYCLVCDELLQVNHDKQEQLAEFTALLYAEVGLPNRFSEMGLYLGNYRKTPFGVHEDGCGVFSFPVAGKKKFRIWKPDYVKKNPKLVRAFSYAKYKADSQVLEARAGDMTYWPSSAWHIAESDGSFSATWSLGVWVDKKQSEVVNEITTELFKRRLGPSGDATMTRLDSKKTKTGEVASLPPTYEQTLAALSTLSPKDMRSAFNESWLAHSSKSGFKTNPSRELKLRSAMTLRLSYPKGLIQWMKDGDETLYAYNGVVVRSKLKALLKFVAALNEGKSSRAPKSCIADLQPLATAGAFISCRSY